MATSVAATRSQMGSCLCKSIRFEVDCEATNFMICHCLSCRNKCGSALVANACFKKPQLRIVEGEEHLRRHNDHNPNTGGVVNRSFCGTCGSPMFVYSFRVPGIVVVLSSLLDGDEDWKVVYEQYCKGKVGYVPFQGSEMKKYNAAPFAEQWHQREDPPAANICI